MTARQESIPRLANARAHWDAEVSKVRYYAAFDGSDEWVEVPGEDFDRLTRLFTWEAIDIVCDAVTGTLDEVRATLAEFSTFREELEKLAEITRTRAEGTEN